MFKENTIRSVCDDKWFNLDLLCGYHKCADLNQAREKQRTVCYLVNVVLLMKVILFKLNKLLC